MKDIVVVMRTMDRLQSRREREIPLDGVKNYLGETLANMQRAGVFTSPHLEDFYIVDSGSADASFLWDAIAIIDYSFSVRHPIHRRTPNLNAAEALRLGSETGAEWVLFCEDDLDVIDGFLDAVALWLERHARDDRRLYTFGSAASEGAHGMMDVSIEAFYGTTCYALRREDAASMAAYIQKNPKYNGGRFYGMGDGSGVEVAHDLHYHQWSRLVYPDIPAFAVCVPCFVQHIGTSSGISKRTHDITYKNWPGRDWRYV